MESDVIFLEIGEADFGLGLCCKKLKSCHERHILKQNYYCRPNICLRGVLAFLIMQEQILDENKFHQSRIVCEKGLETYFCTQFLMSSICFALFQGYEFQMLIMEYTEETNATPAQIWHVWQDVENWNSWDRELESSRLEGPFQSGVRGYLKFKNGPTLNTILTHVEPLKQFVQEAQLFLATVVMTHSIDQIAEKTQVTVKVEICGFSAFFYSWMIGRSIQRKIPLEVKEMLKQALKNSVV